MGQDFDDNDNIDMVITWDVQTARQMENAGDGLLFSDNL